MDKDPENFKFNIFGCPLSTDVDVLVLVEEKYAPELFENGVLKRNRHISKKCFESFGKAFFLKNPIYYKKEFDCNFVAKKDGSFQFSKGSESTIYPVYYTYEENIQTDESIFKFEDLKFTHNELFLRTALALFDFFPNNWFNLISKEAGKDYISIKKASKNCFHSKEGEIGRKKTFGIKIFTYFEKNPTKLSPQQKDVMKSLCFKIIQCNYYLSPDQVYNPYVKPALADYCKKYMNSELLAKFLLREQDFISKPEVDEIKYHINGIKNLYIKYEIKKY